MKDFGFFMRNKIHLIFFALSICLLPAYAAQDGSIQQKYDQALLKKYDHAVKDAEVCEPSEISKNLTAITPANKDLVWKENQQETRVLVVTWTDWNGYDGKIGESVDATREIWVTAVSELQNFIKRNRYAKQDIALRVMQLLGLPPDNKKTRFVEVWVNPKDLFRPSPDPEITDCEAELDFPRNRYVTVCDDYKNWFNNLKNKSYKAGGYPWTRLGYTYDWGNQTSEVGLSEFVIGVGATIEIRSVRTNDDYFKQVQP